MSTGQGRFEANWESLQNYEIPEWYKDAKFGIFIHWGVYSVPAFNSEWYPRNMYIEGTDEHKHHLETYGNLEEFGYKDFIPLCTFEKFDPKAYAELFFDAGAKFVVPVAEHHDGFPMYDTKFSRWCAAKMGPKRDVLGDLANALRDKGIVFGCSSHRAEHFFYFAGGKRTPSDVQNPEFDDLYGPAEPEPVDWHDTVSGPPSKPHLDDWLNRTKEIVELYQPQLIYFDWWIQQKDWKPYLAEFAAFYYNYGLATNKEVAINYKYEAFAPGTAVFDVERGQLSDIRTELWQTDTSVSTSSWGYVKNHKYKEVKSIIGDLVDVVSKNGSLLLNIGPKSDGTIPEKEQEMLLEIGSWLKVNGDAIYGTRPWKVFGEGPTVIEEGAFKDTARETFTGEDIRFTCKDGAIYAIVLAWPGENFIIRSLGLAAGVVGSVQFLGDFQVVNWTQTHSGLHISLPEHPIGDHAFSFKIGLI